MTRDQSRPMESVFEKMPKPQIHKALPGDELYDAITLQVVPRFKDSELSGSQWRHSVVIRFWIKGEIVREVWRHTMDDAIMQLGGIMVGGGVPMEVINRNELLCDQPSCAAKATTRMTIKTEYSDRGERLHEESCEHHVAWRKFCITHSTRGTQSNEDCDDNYIKEPL
jgi:hypothetical protein